MRLIFNDEISKILKKCNKGLALTMAFMAVSSTASIAMAEETPELKEKEIQSGTSLANMTEEEFMALAMKNASRNVVSIKFSDPKSMVSELEEAISGLSEEVQQSFKNAIDGRPEFFVISWEKTKNYTPENREYKRVRRIIRANERYDKVDFDNNYNQVIRVHGNKLERLADYFDMLCDYEELFVLTPEEELACRVDDVEITVNGSSATLIINNVFSSLEEKREKDINSIIIFGARLVVIMSVCLLIVVVSKVGKGQKTN